MKPCGCKHDELKDINWLCKHEQERLNGTLLNVPMPNFVKKIQEKNKTICNCNDACCKHHGIE